MGVANLPTVAVKLELEKRKSPTNDVCEVHDNSKLNVELFLFACLFFVLFFVEHLQERRNDSKINVELNIYFILLELFPK